MRRGRLSLIVASVLLVQLGLASAWRPLGVVPNLALVLVLVLGARGRSSTAAVVALICGLLLDLSSGAYFGLWLVILPAAALAAGLLRRTGVDPGGHWTTPILVVVTTAATQAIILVLMIGVIDEWPVGLLLGRFLAEAALNLLALVLIWPIVKASTVEHDGLAVNL